MLNFTQNEDIHCINLFKSLIVLCYFIILLHISVQVSSEKWNTKKKLEGGAFWRGALFRKNTVLLYALFSELDNFIGFPSYVIIFRFI